jgi:hypothetical protein
VPRRIDSLTEAQKAQFAPYAEQWIANGRSTTPADRPKVEAAVKKCYQYAGLPEPRIVWVPSPIVAAFAGPISHTLLRQLRKAKVLPPRSGQKVGAVRDAVRGAVGDAVRGAVDGAVHGAVDGAVDGAVRDAVRGAVDGAVHGAVDGAVGGAVRDAVDGAVDGAVRGAVGGAVRDAVDGAVDGAVHGAVRGAVRDAVDGAVGDAVDLAEIKSDLNNYWYKWYGGNIWGGWTAWRSFFRDVCGLEFDSDIWERHAAYEQTVLHGGYWWPGSEVCFCSERAHILSQNDANQMHSEKGPALAYQGWELWFLDGVKVTEQIVMRPETLTIKQIDEEENAEVRRVMIERYGYGKYATETKAEILDVDQRTPAHSAPISRMLTRDKHGRKWLSSHDGSTGATRKGLFHMPVPDDVNTCREAHEAICGIDETMIVAEA